MNHRTIALIFMLSLLTVFITNTIADDDVATVAEAPAPDPTPAPQPKPTDPPATDAPEAKPAPEAEGSGEAAAGSEEATTAGCITYTALGALVTVMLANFF